VNPMNRQSNAMPNSDPDSRISETHRNDSQAAAPEVIPPSHLLYWSVRREFWENRSLYLAPVAVASVYLFAYFIKTIHQRGKMFPTSVLDPMQRHEFIQGDYTFAALLIMGVSLIVGVFYCLDCLYGERRERSVLFWKSLPVSDLMTVLSKASIPLVVLPLTTFAVSLAAWWIMLLFSTVVLLGNHGSVSLLWTHMSWMRMSAMLLYHLLFMHGLWWAPFWGWLLLVSAWAKRAPFLWAGLPVLVMAVVEKIALNTNYFASLLIDRFFGGPQSPGSSADSMSMDHMSPMPMQLLASTSFWIGLAVCAAFLALAIRLRRSREPI
jgi:ABC-2 type transport system permease protein